ncbi:hypothetical protein B0H14DRAFT_3172902 [Mycena olivaceomarginata]|nr:hypothetical protein B0H14DRAFT_3172902 [Mycena olivaceomarginata]
MQRDIDALLFPCRCRSWGKAGRDRVLPVGRGQLCHRELEARDLRAESSELRLRQLRVAVLVSGRRPRRVRMDLGVEGARARRPKRAVENEEIGTGAAGLAPEDEDGKEREARERRRATPRRGVTRQRRRPSSRGLTRVHYREQLRASADRRHLQTQRSN